MCKETLTFVLSGASLCISAASMLFRHQFVIGINRHLFLIRTIHKGLTGYEICFLSDKCPLGVNEVWIWFLFFVV